MSLLVAVAEVLLLPLREANADWRLLGWLLTGVAALVTLLAFAQVGGLPWMVHFAYPVLFFFTSVPWPRPVETDVMQWLMQHNATLAAELLRWLGVGAEVQGNLIRLSSGTVGVDEACSGIRSLQGSLMATLFVGEIFELKRLRRVFLLLAGAGWALVTNAARTVFLALMQGTGRVRGAGSVARSGGLLDFGCLCHRGDIHRLAPAPRAAWRQNLRRGAVGMNLSQLGANAWRRQRVRRGLGSY